MNNEAGQFAQELEQLGRRVLDHCHGLPDAVLQWPLPLADPCSLLTLAEQLADTIDYWVLVQIGDRSFPPYPSRPSRPPRTFAELSTWYEEWIGGVHAVLDELPGAFLDLFIRTRPAEEGLCKRPQHKGQLLTTRECLILALAQCAEYAGQILLIRKLFDDGKRLYAEMERERYA